MIYDSFTQNKKKLALLIDPDKQSDDTLRNISQSAEKELVDFIFVGGSLVTSSNAT